MRGQEHHVHIREETLCQEDARRGNGPVFRVSNLLGVDYPQEFIPEQECE